VPRARCLGPGAHGFARRKPWRLLEREERGGEPSVLLELVEDAETLAHWPHRFRARLAARLGADASAAWNPRSRAAERMADLGDERTRVPCVESANIGAHAIELAPCIAKARAASQRRRLGLGSRRARSLASRAQPKEKHDGAL